METNLHLNLSTMLRTWITWYYYISPGVFVKREFKKDLRGLKWDLVIGTGKSCSCWKLMNDLLAMLVLIEACIYARSGKYHGLASNILFLWSSSYIMGMNPVCLSLIVQSDGQRTSSKWIACAVLTKHKFPEYEILLNWFRWYSCDWRKPWDSQTEKPFSNSRICKITEKGQLDQL